MAESWNPFAETEDSDEEELKPEEKTPEAKKPFENQPHPEGLFANLLQQSETARELFGLPEAKQEKTEAEAEDIDDKEKETAAASNTPAELLERVPTGDESVYPPGHPSHKGSETTPDAVAETDSEAEETEVEEEESTPESDEEIEADIEHSVDEDEPVDEIAVSIDQDQQPEPETDMNEGSLETDVADSKAEAADLPDSAELLDDEDAVEEEPAPQRDAVGSELPESQPASPENEVVDDEDSGEQLDINGEESLVASQSEEGEDVEAGLSPESAIADSNSENTNVENEGDSISGPEQPAFIDSELQPEVEADDLESDGESADEVIGNIDHSAEEDEDSKSTQEAAIEANIHNYGAESSEQMGLEDISDEEPTGPEIVDKEESTIFEQTAPQLPDVEVEPEEEIATVNPLTGEKPSQADEVSNEAEQERLMELRNEQILRRQNLEMRRNLGDQAGQAPEVEIEKLAKNQEEDNQNSELYFEKQHESGAANLPADSQNIVGSDAYNPTDSSGYSQQPVKISDIITEKDRQLASRLPNASLASGNQEGFDKKPVLGSYKKYAIAGAVTGLAAAILLLLVL